MVSIYVKALISVCLFAFFTTLCSANDGGWSDTYHKKDSMGKYSFGYKIVDKKGAKQSREEHGDPWTKMGRYSIQDVDGRQRFVSYYADKQGFRAKIDTNEPGTGNVDAANAIYNGPDQHGHSETYVPSGNDGNESHNSEPHGQTNSHEENYAENDHASYDGSNVQHVYQPQNSPTEVQYVQAPAAKKSAHATY